MEPDQKVIMIGHQAVLLDFDGVAPAGFHHPIDEFQPVFLIMEERQPFYPAVGHVVNQAGDIDAWSARHIPLEPEVLKIFTPSQQML